MSQGAAYPAVVPIPGPAALGRGVIINAGQPVPEPWADAPVYTIDEAGLSSPASVVAALHGAWAARIPVVIALAVDPGRFRAPESFAGVEPWTLAPDFEPWLDRLHFLVWANTYDARGEEPVWWWSRKAARLTGVSVGGSGDVLLPDGRPAWIDGGPRTSLPASAVAGLAVVHRESVELGRLSEVPSPVAPAADLAPDQLAAVGHPGGPARIIAPAGSGKTRVLTERLRHLIVDRGYERDIVVAVAYNKKAQEELESRATSFRPRVRTLNSLGYSLLADARGSAPRVLDEREVRRLIERLVQVRRQRANTDPIAPYVEALTQVRLGLWDPEEVEEERDDVPGLGALFGAYRAALAQEGVIDFDEQIYGAIELLLGDGEFRRRAQGSCRHLLVDEFQDLTPAHVLMLRLLATPDLDVFGVGDDDQVIYGHAGADPGFLIDFSRLFPGAGDHPLEVNYRCPAAVVTGASALLSYNGRRVPKTIRARPSVSPSATESLRVVQHKSLGGADELVSVVRGFLDAGATVGGVAVLARVNALLLAPQVALAQAGIPVNSALRANALDRTGLRAALAYLRIATADDGAIAGADITEILRRPSRGLPQWFPDRLRRRGGWSLKGLWGLASSVPEKESAKVERLVSELEMLIRAARGSRGTTPRLLRMIREDIGLGGAMSLLDRSKGGEGSSHLDDLEALEQVAGLHDDPGSFEMWLREGLGRPPSAGGVMLSTIHRVKGMEWPNVVVYGANTGILPHRLADDEEEERRILHVAITRCQEQVVVLADAARPSPFLAELDRPAEPRPARAPRAGAGEAGAGAPGAGAVAPKEGAGWRDRRAEAAGAKERRALAKAAPPAGVNPAVEAALRTWRTERARKDSMPPYIILHDRTLLAIAAAQPTSLVALRQVDGIGPAKLELYGDDILAVIEKATE
jgi:DNA helicase-2/ATP-dependent DNA helicase PcrA